MSTQDRISRLAQQLGERLQGASQAPEELQRGVQQVVRGAFDRLELVSREDFDILMDVLQRTRSRVEALEKQVAALEHALDAKELFNKGADTLNATKDADAEDAGAGDNSRVPPVSPSDPKANRTMAEEHSKEKKTNVKQGAADKDKQKPDA